MKHHSTRQQGFSLLEVLIAIVILSVGLLGVAGMQASGLRNNQAAYAKTQATALAMDMADRIRANPKGRDAYLLDTDDVLPAVPGCDIKVGCSPAELAAHDMYEWSVPILGGAENESPILPEGRAIITQAGSDFTITILWRETQLKISEDTDGLQRFECLDEQGPDQACLQMEFSL